MEECSSTTVLDGTITGIRFSLATRHEICKSSISDCPISHASQLSNPFLGLPLEVGKCESCGTGEPGQCEGHFGYIELPIPIYHPDHVAELKRMLSLMCLKCLKMKNRKIAAKNIGALERVFSCCEEASQVSINEVKTTDGACYLELRMPSRSRLREGCWTFLEKYGFRYGDSYSRPLLPSEVMAMLRRLPQETRKKLLAKGYFPQDGYILQYLPVPPNCLSVPDISDGSHIMSSDHSLTLLKKVLKQVEIIKSSRSGIPNFESHEVEANDLQAAVAQYFQFRGTGKASRDVDKRFGIKKELNDSSTKAWLEKMKTLFIRKGSGFSSRSVITGDPYKGVGEIGLPFEIAQRITFEERVSQHNMERLQKLVDEKLCLTYKDGLSTYSLSEGSKGHTLLRPGQVVHRKIMDGDTVFINRPPTTHKHSLQALSVYIHDDHTVKINPLICGPLSADFDGDCVHIFYPQTLAAKAEVLELFSVEKQLLSSHTGNFNLQLATDSLLSLKLMFKNYFFSRKKAHQLAMFAPRILPEPAVVKSKTCGSLWTVLQILETVLPPCFDCIGERHVIRKSQFLEVDFNKDVLPSILNDIITSMHFGKGPKEVLKFFDSLQSLLMENLFSQGFSIGLGDFFIPRAVVENIQMKIQEISPLLYHLRSTYNESVELQLERFLHGLKLPVTNFVLKSSAAGYLIDSKSESALSKVVQQIGFLGLQISDKGKFYTGSLVDDMATLFQRKYPSSGRYPSEEFGLVRSCLFDGLDPYQGMIHSVSSREVMVRSSRGLTEPGTLFKNLMAILRDVVICYDGTVRNMCSNSIVQFEYGFKNGSSFQSEFGAGDPVGVLAATAMSNPAYKAVLDSSPSSNNSWEMMKEILLCGASFKNDHMDRRIILYLNDCGCGREYCQERASYLVKDQLTKVSLKDAAIDFLIEYRGRQALDEMCATEAGLVGHIHLNKRQLEKSKISMLDVLENCQDTINSFRKKKKVGQVFKRVELSFSECCSFQKLSEIHCSGMPCLKFFCQGAADDHLERTCHILADTICPVLLETIIKGDPRVATASIIWISPETTAWIRSPCKSQKGELALDVVLEKEAVKQSGDAWRVVMDCCLPVIHLIDTTRSIPYAIKQVQELLGISCAFEQVVQRLSTSVTMVTKGVLKEHLVLLANSMTCAGNMIGFNVGGIKALSRALNIEVPFTEATLFTPRKCFERAAEKCHKDSLSSIVASCSWGRHVAVGTGSPFDIHWGASKSDLNQQDGVDVYNFLHLVNSSSNPDEVDTSCLGLDIDDIELEDEPSPIRDSDFDKPVFEDRSEFEYAIENEKVDDSRTGDWDSSWGKKVEGAVGKWKSDDAAEKTDDWSNFAAVSCRGNDQSGLSSWGKKLEDPNAQVNDEGTKSSTAWGSSNNWGNAAKVGKGLDQSASGSSWGKKLEEPSAQVDDKGTKSSTDWGSANSWGNAGKVGKGLDQSASGSSWGKKLEEPSAQVDDEGIKSSTAWGSSNNWGNAGKVGKGLDQSAPGSSWGKKLEEPSAQVDNEGIKSSTAWGSSNNWGNAGKVGKGLDQSASGSYWGKKVDETGTEVDDGSKQKKDSATWSSWGKKVEEVIAEVDEPGTKSSVAWDPSNNWDNVTSSSMREKKESLVHNWSSQQRDTLQAGGWDAVNAGKRADQLGSWSSWGNKSKEAGAADDQSTSWGSSDQPKFASTEASVNNWKAHKEESSKAGGWRESEAGKGVDEPVSLPSWEKKVNDAGPMQENQPQMSDTPALAPSNDWGKIAASSNDNESPVHNWRSNSRGWGSSGERKDNRRNRPTRTSDQSNMPRAFTATRLRLDSFTADEQELLSDTEPIMQNIRRIMHQTGYNDGDPLAAEDQSYIIENVFNYHPDKAVKMGDGIDFIMVSRHANFQESRCFYVVSVDGRKQDFSYRKCLENFLKGKYPDKTEAFLAKYFRKPQPRPGWNKVNSPSTEETPGPRRGWNNVNSPSTEETPGPRRGWNNANSPSTEETPGPRRGWNNVNSPSTEEAPWPRRGWNTGNSPSKEETPGSNKLNGPSTEETGEDRQ